MPYERPFPPWVSVPKLSSLLSASPSLLFLMPLKFLSSPLHLVQTQLFSPPCLFPLPSSSGPCLHLICFSTRRAPTEPQTMSESTLGAVSASGRAAAWWWPCPLGDGSWERLLTLPDPGVCCLAGSWRGESGRNSKAFSEPPTESSWKAKSKYWRKVVLGTAPLCFIQPCTDRGGIQEHRTTSLPCKTRSVLVQIAQCPS